MKLLFAPESQQKCLLVLTDKKEYFLHYFLPVHPITQFSHVFWLLVVFFFFFFLNSCYDALNTNAYSTFGILIHASKKFNSFSPASLVGQN